MAKQTGETIFWQGSPVPDPSAKQSPAPKGLPQLSAEASVVLYSIYSIFPFDLFPDRLIIRLNHIDIIHGIFFLSGTTDRIQIIDIRDVSVHYNPLFATLIITPAGPPNMKLKIKFLWKRQAVRAKRILLGVLECHRQQIDLSKYHKRNLLAYVEKIGRAQTPT